MANILRPERTERPAGTAATFNYGMLPPDDDEAGVGTLRSLSEAVARVVAELVAAMQRARRDADGGGA